MERFEALKSAREAGVLAELDYSHQKQPKCPHCAHEYSIQDNEAWELYEEGEYDLDCQHCGEEFTVIAHVSFSYSTDEQDED